MKYVKNFFKKTIDVKILKFYNIKTFYIELVILKS